MNSYQEMTDEKMMAMNSHQACCEMPQQCPQPPQVCPPVVECPEERCVHRDIVFEVPHIVPINTRIINHHIYKHTYIPQYTCCEENTVCNIYEKRCRF